MKQLALFFLFNIILCTQAYRATVFDFTPTLTTNPNQTLLENAEQFIQKIDSSASQDILVFPEYGLTTYDIFDDIKSYSILVPEVNSNASLCTNFEVHKVLQDIACSTRSQRTYTVINVLETVNDKIYNTNIVFGRNGAIIAKYRKINLFDKEKNVMEAGKELVTFKTDFNVTFGIFTCYDILFEYPAIEILKDTEVNDIIFPTAWFSHLPYLHSLSVQDGYQASTRVNLLASNYNHPQNRSGGSGIYTRTQISTVISPSRGTKAVISDIPKANNDKSLCFERKVPGLRGLPQKPNITSYKTSNDVEEHVENYNFELLFPNTTVHNQKLCHKRVCCIFNATISKPFTEDDPKYMFSVYDDGTSTACALVTCTHLTAKSCGVRSANVKNVIFTKISVASTDFNINHFAIPTTLNYDLEPLTNYKYCETDDQITINSENEQTALITFGFYSISAANSIYMNLFVTIFISIFTIQYFKH